MTTGSRLRGNPMWTGLTMAVLSLVLYKLSFGAVGVMIDTRPLGLALGVLALALSVMGLRHSRSGLGVTALAAAALAVFLLANDLFFVYRTESVSFTNGDVRLEGALYLPRRANAPFPAVIFLHGAGEETRHEGRSPARLLARHGFAGLVYDKRGSGESTGDLVTATYEDLAADAVAARLLLSARSDIDRDRIGYKGTSEGGWIAPLAAVTGGAAFIVAVSTTAETPAEQVRYEVGELVRRAGFGTSEVAKAVALYTSLSQFERGGENREELDARLKAAADEPWFEAARYLPAGLPPYEEVEELAWFPAWRTRMDFDAPAYWRELTCPVLLLLGGRDPKMDSQRATASVRQALELGGNSDLTVRVFPNGEHGLVEWWLPARMPPPRFPDGYPEVMVDWLLDKVGSSPG